MGAESVQNSPPVFLQMMLLLHFTAAFGSTTRQGWRRMESVGWGNAPQRRQCKNFTAAGAAAVHVTLSDASGRSAGGGMGGNTIQKQVVWLQNSIKQRGVSADGPGSNPWEWGPVGSGGAWGRRPPRSPRCWHRMLGSMAATLLRCSAVDISRHACRRMPQSACTPLAISVGTPQPASGGLRGIRLR